MESLKSVYAMCVSNDSSVYLNTHANNMPPISVLQLMLVDELGQLQMVEKCDGDGTERIKRPRHWWIRFSKMGSPHCHTLDSQYSTIGNELRVILQFSSTLLTVEQVSKRTNIVKPTAEISKI